MTAPVIISFAGSTKDERCLEVWFSEPVTDATRAWLLAAINEKALNSLVCVACGQPWQAGMSCGQKDNGWNFQTCSPVERDR